MRETYQFQNIDMIEHGIMVNNEYLILLNALKTNDTNYLKSMGFNLTIEQMNFLLENQYDLITMRNYQIYHDCGKPFCKTIDESGKIHYPEHAKKSYEIYGKYFGFDLVAELILNDMNFHILKGDDLYNWIKTKNKSFLASLYLTAWSEIIANSTMFGGFESDSFKIKRKRLIQSGKRLFV
jgi:hypothetical protein